jgi:hypothetical protein
MCCQEITEPCGTASRNTWRLGRFQHERIHQEPWYVSPNFREARGEHGAPRCQNAFGVGFSAGPGKHAAGTNVGRKSLRWDWRLEAKLKSQGKWLGVGGTFLWDFTYLCWNLTRSDLICWANAPCIIGFRSVQVEAIRTGGHSSGGWLVSAFFVVVPGRRGVARRARPARPSRHGVALGPAVCPRNGTTFALEAQTGFWAGLTKRASTDGSTKRRRLISFPGS